ncbi:hypothetical protein [Streptomyces sp. NPDC058583]
MSLMPLLESVRINPGDPAVIPQADGLLATFGSVVRTFGDWLVGFAEGLNQAGAELVKAAGEYANAEELAQADVKDLGALLASSDAFMKESGGRLANMADVSAILAKQSDAANGVGGTPSPALGTDGTQDPKKGEVHIMPVSENKPGTTY